MASKVVLGTNAAYEFGKTFNFSLISQLFWLGITFTFTCGIEEYCKTEDQKRPTLNLNNLGTLTLNLEQPLRRAILIWNNPE